MANLIKISLTAVLFITFTIAGTAQGTTEQLRITNDDLKLPLGDWSGSLTYVDYRTNKPYTMPADLTVRKGKNNRQLFFYNKYPNEPQANDKEIVRISRSGLKIDGKKIASKKRNDHGDITIVVEYNGKDNSKKALIRKSYIFGQEKLQIRKEVLFDTSDQWTKRNEYLYSRKSD